MVIEFNGTVHEDIDFEYGEGTNTARGCGTTFNGEFWYFGGGGQSGSSSRRQVCLNQKLCQRYSSVLRRVK